MNINKNENENIWNEYNNENDSEWTACMFKHELQMWANLGLLNSVSELCWFRLLSSSNWMLIDDIELSMDAVMMWL